jgi:hypothetical protein
VLNFQTNKPAENLGIRHLQDEFQHQKAGLSIKRCNGDHTLPRSGVFVFGRQARVVDYLHKLSF